MKEIKIALSGEKEEQIAQHIMKRMEGMSLRILSMCILKSLCGIVPRMS